MDYYFQICATERYQEKYITFLLQHHKELNLPYPFPVLLSFMASPVLMQGEAVLCFNPDYEVIGALSYIYGTGDHNYQDTHIVQIQAVFLVDERRKTRLFLEGLQFLTQYIAQLDRKVTEFRFWTPAKRDLRRLFAKLAERTATRETDLGLIDEYRAPFSQWHTYGMRFRHESYF
ncbi:hypothetical protein DFP93_107157 [Aneurinibacillus soli]|uniref:Uncharacterized protein n=1 Tax=Aneurinibacillus soli TaxID=1500254 RepID=A0A0U4WIC5_9BACL|nr:hypothetical protein [Aneurinibacillus soli]PYE61766.1 hypothetical protein DFP93_107157 [Aneurinibacillus soli]BAU28376.1 hypothetical protein CB4_02550 [Aneurinibacillus soli]